ncbi:hypothetical protein VTO42DRAFT_1288 [Malbranchea cinnamomea]
MENHLPDKLPFSKKPLRARIIISYIFDYVILIALVLGFFILDRIEPFHQPFSLQNYSLQYPYAEKERIPMGMALAITGGVPVIVIIVYTLFIDGLFSHHSPRNPATGRRKLMGPYRLKDRLWELNCGLLGLFLSQATAFVITTALKNAVGKPRPDIIDRCQPRNVDLGPYQLANYTICTQADQHIMKDGFRSFPSGHSSSAFAGLFYASLYLAGKLHIMDNRGEVWKTLIVMVPTLGASLIAASRIMDARHHPFDVLSGSLLGILCAWGSYRQYFPSLSEPWKKGRAYPIRTWGTISQPPQRSDRARLVQEDSHIQPDEEDYRGMAVTAPAPPFAQRTRTGSTGENPFEPIQPNPYLRRVGTEVPSNYSSSSSDLTNSNAFEMQSRYGSRHTRRLHRTDSTEPLDSRFAQDTSYRSPDRGRAMSPDSPRMDAQPVVPAEPLRNA